MKIKILICALIVIVLTTIITILALVISNINSSKQLELTYKINAGIPYRWEYKIEDENIVKFVKSYTVKDENKGGKVGAPVYTKYIFKGLKEGKTTVTFKLVNFTDGTVESEDKYKVKVDKNNNISILETNK